MVLMMPCLQRDIQSPAAGLNVWMGRPMRDYFLSDAEVGGPIAGWSSFEVWKRAIHDAHVRHDQDDSDCRPLSERLDEQEDRAALRHRRLLLAFRLALPATALVTGGILLWL